MKTERERGSGEPKARERGHGRRERPPAGDRSSAVRHATRLTIARVTGPGRAANVSYPGVDVGAFGSLVPPSRAAVVPSERFEIRDQVGERRRVELRHTPVPITAAARRPEAVRERVGAAVVDQARPTADAEQ